MSQTSVNAAGQSPTFAGVIVESLLKASAVSAEASSEIPFGVMVQRGTTDDSALLLAGAAATDLFGIAVHSHAHAKDLELGTTGLKPKASFSVLRIGSIWVLSEQDVTPQNTVRVRHTAGAGGSVLGKFRVAAVANETFDISSFARWVTSSTAGTPAKLEIDMTHVAGLSADT